nr:PREDICTED: uncharacterized protein LOC105668563 [Linepithema humile]
MENFCSEFCAYLRQYIDVDQTLSKNISNKLKIIMSREIALKYTAIKEINGKKVFKRTRLYQYIEDIYIGLNIKGEYIKESHILKTISNTLSNAKDWEGHRKDRIKNQTLNA